MGGTISCCTAPATPRVAPRKRTKREKGRATPSVVLERTDAVLTCDSDRVAPAASLLQHISEREPDDMDGDPSTNPRTGPLFMQRSRSDIRSEYQCPVSADVTAADTRPFRQT